VVNHIRHHREAVYAAQFAVDMVVPEPFAHGGTRFDGAWNDVRGFVRWRQISQFLRSKSQAAITVERTT
jgi:hypothetical protein